jgi:fructoselysine-6-P-deglycase FrlB-like protein
MRHGPFEIIGPGHYAVLFASEGHGGDLVRNMALEMAEIGSRVVLFTALETPDHPNLLSILLKPGDPELFPLACAVPQELLFARMASDRGWTAGVFRRGGKITARE